MKGIGKAGRRLVRVLLWSGAGIVFLAGLLVLLAYIFEDDIKARAIKELNKHLKAEVLIKGKDIQLSFIKNFPEASLTFRKFKIRESIKGSKKYLAEGEEFSLLFNMLDLWRGKYHIKKVLLADADLRLRVTENGTVNWDIWQSEPKVKGAKEEAPVELFLQRVKLNDVRLTFDDSQANAHLDAHLHRVTLNGKFSEKEYALKGRADGFANRFEIDNITYASGKAISIETEMLVNTVQQKYTVKEGQLLVDEIPFIVRGWLQNGKQAASLDISVKAKEAGIQTLVALLPREYADYLKGYESSGQAGFELTLKGESSDTRNPSVDCYFSMQNATVKPIGKPIELTGLNIKGYYTNGASRNLETSVLELSQFTCMLNGQATQGSVKIVNFRDPYVEAAVKGQADLHAASQFAKMDNIESLAGQVNADIQFKGRISDLKTNAGILRTSLTGELRGSQVAVKIKDVDTRYSEIAADLRFDGNNLDIRELKGMAGSTDFNFQGTFKNLAAFVFLPDQTLAADLRLKSNKVAIEDFISAETSSSKKDTVYSFQFPAAINGSLSFSVGDLKYGRFTAKNITGSVQLQPHKARYSNLRMETLGGQVLSGGELVSGLGKGIRLVQSRTTLTGVQIPALFYVVESFGQNYLTEKQIKGELNADIQLSGSWTNTLDPVLSSFVSLADVTVKNGQLIQFDPLVRLGDFLKIKSLDNLSFHRLHNTISIRNEVITIPDMEVRSSAMNMRIAGTHTFRNTMDYKLQMNVSQLLFGRRQSYEDEFGEIEVDENGGVNLFLAMKGPGDNPKISYDGKASRKNFSKGLRQEGEQINKILQGTTSDGRPVEDLNKPQEDYELQWEDEPNSAEERKLPLQDDALPPKEDERKKAWKDFKKKLTPK